MRPIVLCLLCWCLAAPARAGDVLDKTASSGATGIFLAAVRASGMEEMLRGPGPFSVFAPVDGAFAGQAAGDMAALLADPERARHFVARYIIDVRLRSQDLQQALLSPLEGPMLRVQVHGTDMRVGSTRVLRADLGAGNGVVHLIDGLLVQP